jgi:hypothetical protein
MVVSGMGMIVKKEVCRIPEKSFGKPKSTALRKEISGIEKRSKKKDGRFTRSGNVNLNQN